MAQTVTQIFISGITVELNAMDQLPRVVIFKTQMKHRVTFSTPPAEHCVPYNQTLEWSEAVRCPVDAGFSVCTALLKGCHESELHKDWRDDARVTTSGADHLRNGTRQRYVGSRSCADVTPSPIPPVAQSSPHLMSFWLRSEVTFGLTLPETCSLVRLQLWPPWYTLPNHHG